MTLHFRCKREAWRDAGKFLRVPNEDFNRPV